MNASHIVGGELYYDHLGGDQYQVTLKMYRDCNSATEFDGSITIGVFAGVDGTFLFTQSLFFPGAELVPVELESPCLVLPPQLCIETTSYTGVFTLPPTADGYHLSYQRCCRTAEITNMPNADDIGLTVTIRIPGYDLVDSNSSPRFNELPPVALCLGEPLVFDHSALDPDGDSLAYSLCTPFQGASPDDAVPDQPTPPPYLPIPWLGPTYSETNPIDSDPPIMVDPITGELTVNPTMQGSFVVGVMVREYRNGVLLSESRREFMFKVVLCNATVVSDFQTQFESDQVCGGLTMNFYNQSTGGQTWHWDFGVAGTDADTSNVIAPSFTYPAEGPYTITLLVNQGTVCADTASLTYNVFIQPEAFFTAPPPLCGTEPVTLVAEGSFEPESVVDWDLGEGATPSDAVGTSVTVEFTETWNHTVTLTVDDDGCVDTDVHEVVVYPLQDTDFSAAPLAPQIVGVPVSFADGTEPNGSAIASWAWAINGSPAGTSSPVLDWTSTWPGNYVVTLTTTTEDGCAVTDTMIYEVDGGPITIPNVFSPNGDEENDAFHITNVDHYTNKLQIYSRWGNVVYEATNYKNDWKGTDVPDGTYYYLLHISDDQELEFAGHVTLMR